MDYEVLHKPSYALARIRLDPREQLQAETGAMVSMSDSIKMETGTRGGIARTAPARSRFYSLLALTALLVALLVLAACGGGEEVSEDTPAASSAADASAAAPTVAAPVADSPDATSVSLDEYIMNVCVETQTEMESWGEPDSLRDLSTGLEFVREQMTALEPPAEVADWHEAQLEFLEVFKAELCTFRRRIP